MGDTGPLTNDLALATVLTSNLRQPRLVTVTAGRFDIPHGARGRNIERLGATMAYLKTIAGALAIMAASGMIVDFDLSERDREIHVRVWSADDHSTADLPKDVAVLLTRYVGDKRVVVTDNKV
jgi:hypothetical protein